MATLFPNDFAVASYSTGDRVTYAGVVYEALADVTVTSTTDRTQIPFDNDNWRAVSIRRLANGYSIFEAAKLELNTDDDMINDSIPLFMSLAHQSFTRDIRHPQQRTTTLLTADSQGRIRIPSDLLQVINLRFNGSSTRGSSLTTRGNIEILAGNYEEYQKLEQFYAGGSDGDSVFIPFEFEAPVYWFDDTYFHIAPSAASASVECELIYHKEEPELFRMYPEVNSDGEAINAAGQTLDEFIDGGGMEADFVQAQVFLTNNLFTTSAPDMFLYGTLLNAESYLKDDPRVPQWEARYLKAKAEFLDEIAKFEEYRAHTFQMYSAYSV